MLAISVFAAIADAIHAARPGQPVALDAPATPEAILKALGPVDAVAALARRKCRARNACAERERQTMAKVWARIRETIERHGKAGLLSVVGAAGSVPRETGARIVLQPDGGFYGTSAAAAWNTRRSRPPARRFPPDGCARFPRLAARA